MARRQSTFVEHLLGDEAFQRWVPLSALTPRLDARYYHPAFDEIPELAADRPGQFTPLRDLCSEIQTYEASDTIQTATAGALFPYVTAASFHSGQFVDVKASAHTISSRHANGLVVNQEAVLVSLDSGEKQLAAFYSPAIQSGPIALSRSIRALVPKPDVDAAYLAHELNQRYVTLQILRLPAGTTISPLNFEDLLDIRVVVPSKGQQERVSQSVRARATLLEIPPSEATAELAGPAGATFTHVIDNVEEQLLASTRTVSTLARFLEWQPTDARQLVANIWALPRSEQTLIQKNVIPPPEFLDWLMGTSEPFCIFNSLHAPVTLGYSFCKQLKLSPNADERKLSALFWGLEAWKEESGNGVSFPDFIGTNRPLQRAFDGAEEILRAVADCCPPLLALRVNRLGRPFGVFLVSGPPQWPDAKGSYEALRSQGVIWASYLRQQLQLLPQLQKLAAEQTVTNLVHRLNHPLSRIDVAVDLLTKWALSSAVGEGLVPDEAAARDLAAARGLPLESYSATAYLRRIREAHGELLNLSRKIRLMARAESHSKPAWIPVASLTKHLWSCVQSQLHGKACELINNVQADAEGAVYADMDLLCEALRNVVDNSVREMVHSQPRLEIGFHVQSPQPGFALLEVIDNGLPADKELINGAFEWGTSGHFSSGKGSGYGLPIVRQIFSAVLGACELERNPTGPGCRFWGKLQYQLKATE